MMPSHYRTSLGVRLSVLFSPGRLVLCVASFVWFAVATALYAGHGDLVDWLGPLSVVPLLTFTAFTVATDMRYRREGLPTPPTDRDS